MQKKYIVILGFLFAMGLLFSGCAGKSEEGPNSDLPGWILSPEVEGGIAAAECVRWTGDFSMDKAEATALGRATLAKQIDTKVQAMDKTYRRKISTEEGTSTGGTFESVSKQVAKKHLKGSRVKKVDTVEIDGKKQLCVLCVLDPGATKKLFKDILKQSGTDLSPQDESVLYEEFKAKKAQEELQEEMQKME
ncbi:MAG: hypothetical protein ACOCZ2_01645 [Thermodesulfobacteriota bacterium]